MAQDQSITDGLEQSAKDIKKAVKTAKNAKRTLKAAKAVAKFLAKAIKLAVKVAIKVIQLIINLIVAFPPILIVFAVVILIYCLIGLFVTNPAGSQEYSQKIDFNEFVTEVCPEFTDDSDLGTCQAYVASELSDLPQSKLNKLLSYFTPQEMNLTYAVLLTEACESELDKTLKVIEETVARFNEAFPEPLPQYAMEYYALDGLSEAFTTLYMNPPRTTWGEDSTLFSGESTNLSQIQKKNYNAGVEINNTVGTEYYNFKDLEYIVATMTVSIGDSHPPTFNENQNASFFDFFTRCIAQASGVFFEYNLEVEKQEEDLSYIVHYYKADTKEETEVEEIKYIDPNTGFWKTETVEKEVTYYKATPTWTANKTAKVNTARLVGELKKFQPNYVASYALLTARYVDYMTEEVHFFQEDAIDAVAPDFDTRKLKYIYSGHNPDEVKMYDVRKFRGIQLAEQAFPLIKCMGKSGTSYVMDFLKDLDAFHIFTTEEDNVIKEGPLEYSKCLFDEAYNVYITAKVVGDEYFYRFIPSFYYECYEGEDGHPPDKYYKCPICGKPIIEVPDITGWAAKFASSFFTAIGKFAGDAADWAKDFPVVKSIGAISSVFDSISKGSITLGNGLSVIVTQHLSPVYTYQKALDSEDGPLNEKITTTDYGDDLSPGSTEVEEKYWTISQKQNGYYYDLMTSNGEVAEKIEEISQIPSDVISRMDRVTPIENGPIAGTFIGENATCLKIDPITHGDCNIYGYYHPRTKAFWDRAESHNLNPGYYSQCTTFVYECVYEVYGGVRAHGNGYEVASWLANNYSSIFGLQGVTLSEPASLSRIRPGSVFSTNFGGAGNHVTFINDIDLSARTITVSDGNVAGGGIRIRHVYDLDQWLNHYGCQAYGSCYIAYPKAANWVIDPTTTDFNFFNG